MRTHYDIFFDDVSKHIIRVGSVTHKYGAKKDLQAWLNEMVGPHKIGRYLMVCDQDNTITPCIVTRSVRIEVTR